MLQAHLGGLAPSDADVALHTALNEHLATIWDHPDQGMWEERGEPQHFTYSKVMAWVAFDRAVKAMEKFGREDKGGRWRQLRDHIHNDICQKAYSPRWEVLPRPTDPSSSTPRCCCFPSRLSFLR